MTNKNWTTVAEHLDIFSLGAIAYHVFSGAPPASNGLELSNKLRVTNGLQISSVLNGTSESLQEWIPWSTLPIVADREGLVSSVDDFLDLLEKVEIEAKTMHLPFRKRNWKWQSKKRPAWQPKRVNAPVASTNMPKGTSLFSAGGSWSQPLVMLPWLSVLVFPPENVFGLACAAVTELLTNCGEDASFLTSVNLLRRKN